MRALIAVLICIAAVNSSCAMSRADEAALRKRIDSELPSAMARLEAFYTHVTGSATREEYRTWYDDETVSRLDAYSKRSAEYQKTHKGRFNEPVPKVDFDSMPPPDVLTQRSSVDFSVNGGMVKVEVHRILAKSFHPMKRVRELPDDPHGSFAIVLCKGPDYSFGLTRSTDKDEWEVKRFGEVPPDKPLAMNATNYLFAPFCIYANPLAQIMKDPAFAIKKLTETKLNNRECIRIDFEGARLKRGDFVSGWVVLAPGAAWAIQQYAIASKAFQGTNIYTVDYGADVNGIPMLHRVSDTGAGQKAVFTVENLSSRVVTPSDFTFAAYGLPDLAKAKGTPPSRLPYWVFGIAFACLLLAFLLNRYGRSRRSDLAA
jgi:hypothetical protein